MPEPVEPTIVGRRRKRHSPLPPEVKFKCQAKARLVLTDTKAAGRTIGNVFAPTGKHVIFRLLTILVLWMGMCVNHIDVFLNSPIREKYKITDLGPAKRFLGIHIEYTMFKSVFLHQHDFVQTILTKYANWCNIFGNTVAKTPLPMNYQELVHNEWRPDATKDVESWHWYSTFLYFNIFLARCYIYL
jgi:hypothetical protein